MDSKGNVILVGSTDIRSNIVRTRRVVPKEEKPKPREKGRVDSRDRVGYAVSMDTHRTTARKEQAKAKGRVREDGRVDGPEEREVGEEKETGLVLPTIGLVFR